MNINLDVLSEWFVSWGFPADINVGNPAPLELLFPLARSWHRRERARGEDSGLAYWINLLREVQRWEEYEVSDAIQPRYNIVQIRGTNIVGVVKATLDAEFLLVEFGANDKHQIIIPAAFALIKDGIVFDYTESAQAKVSGL